MDKPLRVLLAALFASVLATPARSDLIISELCDPQNNFTTDRFIEIYNSGPDPVDLAGWTVIAMCNTHNGPNDTTSWALSGSLPPGQAKVCGGPTTVTGFTVHFQSAKWATTAGYMNWNGNIGDGARLMNGSTVVDLVVATADGLFRDGYLERNASIGEPNPVYTASEWTFHAVTLATDANPGTHNGSAPPPPGPRISNIVTDPASPVANVGVHVQAAVVDTSGEITAVTLRWGSSAASLANVIGMVLLSDSTYRTSTEIPGQAPGASVYYRVHADGPTQSSQSAISSFTISGAGGSPPTILSVGEMSDSTLLVFFSEPVEETSAETPANYAVDALAAVTAERDPAQTSQVLITVRGLTAGTRTLAVNGVSDLGGSTAFGATRSFNYVDVTIPAGYYDGVIGLTGAALRSALKNLIDNHTVRSYSYALTAFQTTDVKPNGKVWDVYSDVPGGTPPYEYSFGETGQGATEGLGYNREHSFPQSWFGEASPMVSDLHHLYPTDAKVNGYRANYPFGDVGTPTTTSLNGSKLGPSVTPGYGGTVFEPIDAYKGDLARGQFYMATRYFGESGSWPGSPSFASGDLTAWAADAYMEWCANDPVSWKERMRNGAIWLHQNNRNPFIDHPEFVALIYDPGSVLSVGDAASRGLRLRPNAPNPFAARTTIVFDLARSERVTLRIYDVTGRRVRTLAAGRELTPGSHALEWNGRDDAGAVLDAGLYFCRLETETASETRRMVFAR